MNIGKILAGMGVLIGIYLLVRNYTGSVSIISSLSKATTSTVSALQGR